MWWYKFIEKISDLEVGWIKKSEFGTKHQSNTVYDPNKIIPTITACDYKEPKKILDFPCIAASRGRYNNDGSTSQRLEINDTGNTNTITSVQKDNYVLVKEATKTGYKKAYPSDSINLEQSKLNKLGYIIQIVKGIRFIVKKVWLVVKQLKEED